MTNSSNTLPAPHPWPSACINWQINGSAALPQLQLQFGFNSQAYEGLYQLAVTGQNTLTASFTSELDAATATAAINYSVSIWQEAADPVKVKISSVALNADGRSVTIVVESIGESKDQRLLLNIANIAAADGSAVFSGTAQCTSSGSDEPGTSPVTESARRDLQFYRQLAAEPTGMEPAKLSVESTLVKEELIFSSEQFVALKEEWLAPICAFLADRADGKTTVTAPVKTHAVTLGINIEHLCTGELFRLGCSLLIRRGDIWNMLALQPYTESTATPYDVEQFAAHFERVLQNEKWMLRVLKQTVNSDSPGAIELWTVRKGLQADQPINFSIDSGTPPKFFAARPISNRVETQLNVPIYDFNPATGIDFRSPARQMSFSGTDVDEWMKIFFRSIDVLLSPAYSVAIRQVDAKSGTHYHSALSALRLKLADTASKWLIPVFESNTFSASVVQESFRRQLQAQLSYAYNISAAVQLNATVVADGAQDTVAQFSGPVTVVSGSTEKKTDGEHSSLSPAFTPGELDIEPGSGRPFTFMVSAAQPSDNSSALVSTTDLRLQYSANRIGDHGDGNTEPWWIDFITEEGRKTFNAALGELQLPVLLRKNPMEAQPVPVEQSGQPSEPPADATFQSVFDWDYTFRYSRSAHVPHDILSFTLDFSGKKRETKEAVVPAEVFAPLAQFATVFPAVERVFSGMLAKMDDNTDPSQVAICDRALEAFIKMADRIVSSMDTKVPALSQHTQDKDAMNFNLKEGRAMIENVEALVITVLHKVTNGMGDLSVRLDDCVTVTYADNPPGNTRFYFKDRNGRIVTAQEGRNIPMRTIVVSRINIMDRQTVETEMALSRNAELVPGERTAEPLVYRMGAIGFPERYHPLIEHNSPIDVSMIFGDGKSNVVSLIEHFENLFIAVIRQSQQPFLSLEINCSYSYPIAEGLSDVTMPIIMLPFRNVDMRQRPYALGDVTLQKVIETLSEAIKTWYRNYQPAEKDASFGLDIFFYSMLTGQPQPLLHLRSLSLGVRYVTDLPIVFKSTPRSGS